VSAFLGSRMVLQDCRMENRWGISFNFLVDGEFPNESFFGQNDQQFHMKLNEVGDNLGNQKCKCLSNI